MNKQIDGKCALILENMVFDKVSFVRKELSKSESEPSFSFQVITSQNETEDIYKVTLIIRVDKENEYEIEISLTGFFSVNKDAGENSGDVSEIVSKNTVAILMPYIRSELSLLTAQPGIDCIVLPPFNIAAMMEKKSKE